jgi:hypothetical protein
VVLIAASAMEDAAGGNVCGHMGREGREPGYFSQYNHSSIKSR